MAIDRCGPTLCVCVCMCDILGAAEHIREQTHTHAHRNTKTAAVDDTSVGSALCISCEHQVETASAHA